MSRQTQAALAKELLNCIAEIQAIQVERVCPVAELPESDEFVTDDELEALFN